MKEPDVEIVRCAACDGYGWLDDEETGEGECRWCGGIGYVYRDERGVDRRIPEADYEQQAERLEAMELQRLREMGYSGTPKKPWEQAIRRGTKLGDEPGTPAD
jgi:hypothetical protein